MGYRDPDVGESDIGGTGRRGVGCLDGLRLDIIVSGYKDDSEAFLWGCECADSQYL